MAYIRSQPTRDGIVFSIENHRGSVSLALTRQEVAETVANMCTAARLPEPWKKG